MLGLGGGCGAVGLLHEFPCLEIDAVESIRRWLPWPANFNR